MGSIFEPRHPKKLFDGIIGDINFRDGHWNGFIRTKDYQKGVNERNSRHKSKINYPKPFKYFCDQLSANLK